MNKKSVLFGMIFISCILFSGCKKVIISKDNTNEKISFNTELIEWLQNTTDISVYLPSELEAMQKDCVNNYYYEATGDAESYSINIYKSKVSVAFNDKKDLLEKNGPISEADFVGTISGGNIDNNFSFEIPTDAKSFELIKGITAYEKDNNILVWWEEQGWNFNYIGTSNLATLESLAKAWIDTPINISEKGNVRIVGANKYTFYYEWERDEKKYSFITESTDFENTIKILNSFIKVNYSLENDENSESENTAQTEVVTSGENEFIDNQMVIQEQSFDVELDSWGKVRFVSCRPNKTEDFEDAYLYIVEDNKVIYALPYLKAMRTDL